MKTSAFYFVVYRVLQVIVWIRLLLKSGNLSTKSLSDGKDLIDIKMCMKTLTGRRDQKVITCITIATRVCPANAGLL